MVRVVVVDNDPDALDLLMLDLRLEGHDVVGFALRGEDGIALCESLRPDVLVVDYRMPPGPNGVEVARAVRGIPGLRTVLYSNYGGDRLRNEIAGVGATYLAKGQLTALRKAVAAA